MKSFVELSKPVTIFIGYQRGKVPPEELKRPWMYMYFHNQESYRKLWRRVELESKSRRDLNVNPVGLSECCIEAEDVGWIPKGRNGIHIVITRQS